MTEYVWKGKLIGHSYAINLARDFGPRLFSYAVGYKGVWSAGGYYFWVSSIFSSILE